MRLSRVISCFLVMLVTVLAGHAQVTFQQSWSYPTYLSQSVAAGDFNGDGELDIAVTSYTANDSNNGVVNVFLGNGDGTFSGPEVLGSGGTFTNSIVVADVNKDGKADLVISSSCGGNCEFGAVGVLLGNGDGTFQTAITNATGRIQSQIVTVADINGDGKPDLVIGGCPPTFPGNICNGSSDYLLVAVMLGNGDGTFQSPTVITPLLNAPSVFSLTAGDANGDGKQDLFFVSSDSVCVMLGNGDGTFQPLVQYLTGGLGTTSVVLADINGDGKPDLLVANSCIDSGCNSGSIGVLLGNGDGTFQAAVSYATLEPATFSLVTADVNGDAKLDALVANSSYPTQTLDLLLGNGNGTFQPATLLEGDIPTGRMADHFLAVGDFNGDGRPDFVGASTFVFVNTTSNFSPQPTTTSLTSSMNPSFVDQLVTFTATVQVLGDNYFPTGTVSFYDGTTLIATGNLANGVATYTTSTLTLGKHSITATFNGAPYLLSSTSVPLTQLVQKYPTIVQLTSSFNPSYVSQTVTFTAIVTSQYSTPTGTVTFKSGSSVLGSAPLNNGVANLNYSFSTPGTMTIIASYPGDSQFAPAKSGLRQQVLVAPRFAASYSFAGTPDGANPTATLILNTSDGGLVYGTTVKGGPNGNGTVFEITSKGKETILDPFPAGDGYRPAGHLVWDSSAGPLRHSRRRCV
jgi:uncharacterized repeat protein (TIGR03803 family)